MPKIVPKEITDKTTHKVGKPYRSAICIPSTGAKIKAKEYAMEYSAIYLPRFSGVVISMQYAFEKGMAKISPKDNSIILTTAIQIQFGASRNTQ